LAPSLSWEIEKSDELGRVYLSFDEKIDIEYSKPMLNKENIDLYIKPFIGEYDTNATRNLTIKSWNVENFEDEKLEIQLVFEKPLDISVNFMYDTLVM